MVDTKGQPANLILAVGVGTGAIQYDVTNPAAPPLRHAIIYGLKDALLSPPYSYPVGSFTIDYVEADVESGTFEQEQHTLQAAIRHYLNTFPPDIPWRDKPQPKLILPIASTTAAAVRDEFWTDPRKIPIVFVVISDPVYERLVNSLSQPGGNATGVSTQMSQVAPRAVEKFLRVFKDHNRPLGEVCWMHREKFPPSDLAFGSIRQTCINHNATPDRQLVNDRQHVDRLVRDTVESQIGKPSPTLGMFISPDDMVVSNWQNVITLAQQEKGVPTFWQVLEFVKPDPNTPARPCALGGYGIPGKTVGERTAEIVDKVLKGTKPGEIAVTVLDETYYKLWWNNDVARALHAPRLTEAEADQIFGPPTP